jgi:hypothetical protein
LFFKPQAAVHFYTNLTKLIGILFIGKLFNLYRKVTTHNKMLKEVLWHNAPKVKTTDPNSYPQYGRIKKGAF